MGFDEGRRPIKFFLPPAHPWQYCILPTLNNARPIACADASERRGLGKNFFDPAHPPLKKIFSKRGADDAGWGNGLCWAPHLGGGSVGGAPKSVAPAGYGRDYFFELEAISLQDFKATPMIFRLAAEARRMRVAYFFEPYSAVYSSSITPLPHQIAAVYGRLLKMNPIRFVLADDPGAGKTVMTGLLIKELIIRRDADRCLIVCPGSLVEQWQDELLSKFDLHFDVLNADRLASNAAVNRGIVSIDTVARNESLKIKLRATRWNLIVCDEAHKMSATLQGNEVKYTKRFRLGELLGKITKHLLFLTATPHNGKDEDFRLFMSLLAPERFKDRRRLRDHVDVSDLMRRLVKEDLLTFDGTPLFPERVSYTVNYRLSPIETELYQAVTDYVVDGFNRAERLKGNKRNAVGFAMTILQRRLASSPLAILKSLDRRARRLQSVLHEHQSASFDERLDDFLDEYRDFSAADLDKKADEILERATARIGEELQAEIQTLLNLAALADRVLKQGDDRKWRELSNLLLDDQKIFDREGAREKLVIFTEHRDTLDYLQQRITNLLGRADSVAVIHGSLSRRERRAVEHRFRHDKNLAILIATDAAGEGINLQVAHLMINYDLPWNPNRLEQRFGRIHRIGQTKICCLWNLVTADTREGHVLDTLLKKLDIERNALGGKVFDILGKISFDNKPLSELLIDAVRHADRAQRLSLIVNESLDAQHIRRLLDERALTKDSLNPADITGLVQSMGRDDVLKLQPYSVENFFKTALKMLGGSIYPRGNGRFEIAHIPRALRDKVPPVRLVCFSKKNIAVDHRTAELIAPGHPLLETIIDATIDRFGAALQQGAVFVDDNDLRAELRLMFIVENHDHRLNFVEVFPDGRTRSIGRPPYFDYRDPTPVERDLILTAALKTDWLSRQLDRRNFLGAALIASKAWLDNKIISVESTVDRRSVENIAMNAVIALERRLGNRPVDVSAKKLGYDVESAAPDGRLRFIEVKGRRADADTVTVTENEIRTALNDTDNFILALVLVDRTRARVVYLKAPFHRPLDFGAVSANYKISALLSNGKIIIDISVAV